LFFAIAAPVDAGASLSRGNAQFLVRAFEGASTSVAKRWACTVLSIAFNAYSAATRISNQRTYYW